MTEVQTYLEISTCDPLKYKMDNPFLIVVIGVAPIMQYKHVRNKNSNPQGSLLNVVKVIFHTLTNCS